VLGYLVDMLLSQGGGPCESDSGALSLLCRQGGCWCLSVGEAISSLVVGEGGGAIHGMRGFLRVLVSEGSGKGEGEGVLVFRTRRRAIKGDFLEGKRVAMLFQGQIETGMSCGSTTGGRARRTQDLIDHYGKPVNCVRRASLPAHEPFFRPRITYKHDLARRKMVPGGSPCSPWKRA
jgi:hypothetical protein